MNGYCIGYPFCKEKAEGDAIVCQRCWESATKHKEGKKLMAEFLAIRRQHPKRNIAYKKSLNALTEYLRGRREFSKRKADNIKLYTIRG